MLRDWIAAGADWPALVVIKEDPLDWWSLRSMIKPGDLFNDDVVREFFEEKKSLLPADASLDDLKIQKNVKEGTASLRFDFFTCPKSAN